MTKEIVSNQVAQLRERSGSVDSNSRLVDFLYILMRDHLPAGVVEGLVLDSRGGSTSAYTNGWLALYAQDCADRLMSTQTVELIPEEEIKEIVQKMIVDDPTMTWDL